MTEHEVDFFRSKFPNLFREIKNRTKFIKIDGIRTNREEAEKAAKSKRSTVPTVVDFVRLCKNQEEAFEIIDYMEEKQNIDSEYAQKLKNQLTNKGLRSFGSKRNPGEYPTLE